MESRNKQNIDMEKIVWINILVLQLKLPKASFMKTTGIAKAAQCNWCEMKTFDWKRSEISGIVLNKPYSQDKKDVKGYN